MPRLNISNRIYKKYYLHCILMSVLIVWRAMIVLFIGLFVVFFVLCSFYCILKISYFLFFPCTLLYLF